MQDVVEGLQDKVRQIHEAEQRTLEQQRLHLTQEHDERISHLRIKHERVGLSHFVQTLTKEELSSAFMIGTSDRARGLPQKA